MNAKHMVGNFLILSSIEVYNLVTKKIETLDKDDINFSYRSSSNLENKVIISATLIGTEGDPALIRSRLKENIKYRKDTQPSAIYNAGSVFKIQTSILLVNLLTRLN